MGTPFARGGGAMPPVSHVANGPKFPSLVMITCGVKSAAGTEGPHGARDTVRARWIASRRGWAGRITPKVGYAAIAQLRSRASELPPSIHSDRAPTPSTDGSGRAADRVSEPHELPFATPWR